MKETIEDIIPSESRSAVQKDAQSITKDWEPLQPLIEGVVVKQVCNILKDNGYLTELYRNEWNDKANVQHVFQTVLYPNKKT